MKNHRFWYRPTVLIVFILLNACVIFGISQIISYLNEGADRSSMLQKYTSGSTNYHPIVTWNQDYNVGEELSPINISQIEEDYINSWYVKNEFLKSKNTENLDQYFTESALQKLMTTINEGALTTHQVTYKHTIEVEFFSEDGSILIFKDKNVLGYHKIYHQDSMVVEQAFKKDFKVVMLLEDGIWKIRHFITDKTHPISSLSTKFKSFGNLTLEGINYQPQNTPWELFTEQFDSTSVEKDLLLIKDLNLNTVRIFIDYHDFGKEWIDEQSLNRLSTFLDIAKDYELNVMITLFDFYGDYSLSDLSNTYRHLETLINRVKGHEAIIAWDIKNEPDLDFETRGKERVLTWLSETIRMVRLLDSETPITIGWSSANSALDLEQEVDFISYHFYGDLNNFEEIHSKIVSKTNKPVVIQEMGWSTYDGNWKVLGYSENKQAALYRSFLEKQKRDNFHYLSWTLYDFEMIPSKVKANLPWRNAKQSGFGIIDTKGNKKPSYQIIKER